MNKVYIIIPLIALAIFGGFYVNFSKGYDAKVAAALDAYRANQTKKVLETKLP